MASKFYFITFLLIILFPFFLIGLSQPKQHLVSNPNVVYKDGQKTVIPWDKKTTDNKTIREFCEVRFAKKTVNSDKFIQLLFQHKEKLLETFQFLNKSIYNYSRSNYFVINYFCQANKTIPFPDDWRTSNLLKTQVFPLFTQGPGDPYLDNAFWKEWVNFLKVLPSEKSQFLATINGLDPKNKNRFFIEMRFFEAYYWFTSISGTELYSDVSFLAFLNNLQVSALHKLAQKLIFLQRNYYFPDFTSTVLKDANLDLSPILDLDIHTLQLNNISPEQLAIFDKLDLNSNEVKTWKARDWTKDILKKDFWTTLNGILENQLGIDFLFWKSQKYSLKNLFQHPDIKKIIQLDDVKDIFASLNTQAQMELLKLIFTNQRGLKHGINNAKNLKDSFEQTKTNLLTELHNILERIYTIAPSIDYLPIKGTTYSVTQLLANKQQLLSDSLNEATKKEIKELIVNQVGFSDWQTTILQLSKFEEIKSFLAQALYDKKTVLKLKIATSEHDFTSLLIDFIKKFHLFSAQSLSKLSELSLDQVSLSQLQTAYQESFSSTPTPEPSENKPSENNKPSQKDNKSIKTSNSKSLPIALGVSGAVVFVGGGATGLAYWFVKMRK